MKGEVILEAKKIKYDESFKLNAKTRNKMYIEKTTGKLLAYYADNEKKIRVNHIHLCKSCYYYNTDRIGGSAMTTSNCINCGQEMMFSNTCVDILCENCAKELKACKHCGQKMD